MAILLIALILAACQARAAEPTPVPQTEVNKDIYRRILIEYFQNGDEAVLYELYPANHVNHSNNVHGPDEWKQHMASFRAAFSDPHYTIDFQIAEGDMIMNYWTLRQTHTGELWGIPASGKEVTISGMSVGRIVDGKIVEEWTVVDLFRMMLQIGAVYSAG
jgi:predicted ester cyclase